MPLEPIDTAWEIARQTTAYLFAYAFAPILALGAQLLLVAWGTRLRQGKSTASRLRRQLLLGITAPSGTRALERDLRRRDLSAAGPPWLYLGWVHGLTAYYWILLGPLLGRDFLLSHVVGMLVFVLLCSLLGRVARIAPSTSSPPSEGFPAERATLPSVGREAIRFAALAAVGLAAGSLIAAWGFSEHTFAAAELGAPGLPTQSVNALLGASIALAGVVPPITNLFVGTYLWKVGLAHAGIVAFFCAAAASPLRWPLYRRIYGGRAAFRLALVLVVSALCAGLVTAWSWGILDLEIRYRLIPSQLWP